MPAVANLHSRYAQQKFNLQDAIGKINSDQYTQAYGVRQHELDTEEKQREFDRQLAAQQAAEAANRAASAGVGGASPSFGYSGGGGGTNTPAGPNVPAGLQQLYNQVYLKPGGGTWSDQELINDYNATYKSAMYGNVRDQQKLQLYHSVSPGLFGGSIPTQGSSFGSTPAYKQVAQPITTVRTGPVPLFPGVR